MTVNDYHNAFGLKYIQTEADITAEKENYQIHAKTDLYGAETIFIHIQCLVGPTYDHKIEAPSS